MYEKGIQTRNHIYHTAKAVFYEFGYSKTRIQVITERADVPIGLFTYYFKTKDNIVKRIYSEFLTQVSLCITESLKTGFDNSVLRHAVLSWVYYDIILSDPGNARFYAEVLRKKSNYSVLSGSAAGIYRRYAEDFNIFLSDHDFKNLLFLDFGARREFFLNYFNDPAQDSIDDIIFLINGIVPRLMGIDQNTVSTLLYKGISMAKTIPHDHIRFLV